MTGATDWLSASVRGQGVDRRLKPGEALFRQGKRTVGLYQILSGTVRLLRVDRSGREIVLFTAGPGDTIAEASLFSSSYHCDAVAATDAVVRFYPKALLTASFASDAKAMQGFTAMLARQVMNLRTRLEQRNIHSARDRVGHYLALNVEADGRTVKLPGTIKNLAGELGLTHEALYRTLAEMTADGEIERSRGTIRLAVKYDPDHM